MAILIFVKVSPNNWWEIKSFKETWYRINQTQQDKHIIKNKCLINFCCVNIGKYFYSTNPIIYILNFFLNSMWLRSQSVQQKRVRYEQSGSSGWPVYIKMSRGFTFPRRQMPLWLATSPTNLQFRFKFDMWVVSSYIFLSKNPRIAIW